MDAFLNILKTTTICLILTLGAILFTNDANVLVITPIEKMISDIRKLAQNPISGMMDS